MTKVTSPLDATSFRLASPVLRLTALLQRTERQKPGVTLAPERNLAFAEEAYLNSMVLSPAYLW